MSFFYLLNKGQFDVCVFSGTQERHCNQDEYITAQEQDHVLLEMARVGLGGEVCGPIFQKNTFWSLVSIGLGAIMRNGRYCPIY